MTNVKPVQFNEVWAQQQLIFLFRKLSEDANQSIVFEDSGIASSILSALYPFECQEYSKNVAVFAGMEKAQKHFLPLFESIRLYSTVTYLPFASRRMCNQAFNFPVPSNIFLDVHGKELYGYTMLILQLLSELSTGQNFEAAGKAIPLFALAVEELIKF